MDLQQIKYIIALSQELNFQRAARRMNVTQPTLSQQVKKLEDELGAPLFERSTRGVRLTASGQRFLPHAFAALEELQKGTEELSVKEGEMRGTVRLGAIPTMGPYLLPDIVRRVRREAPHLHLQLFEETTASIVESLKKGKLDMGILSLPLSEAGIVTRELHREPFFLAVASNHKLAARKSVSPSAIENEKMLILQEGHCFGDQSLEYCRKSRRDDQVIFEGGSLTSVMQLAATGEGVTLVPRMAADPKKNPGLHFIPFSKPSPWRSVAIAWRVSSPLTRAQKFIMGTIEKAASRK